MAPPAPWTLTGSAYVLHVRGGKRLASRMLMFVRYSGSPVGPYDELLYCRRRRFGGQGRWTVDAIVVSSEESVDGGRANWGLPKDLAAFAVSDLRSGRVQAVVSDPNSGRRIARIAVQGRGPSVPVGSKLVPKRWMDFAQLRDGTRFDFSPRLTGSVRLARVRELEVGAPFPPLGKDDVRLALHLPSFSVEFPPASLQPEAA